MPNSFINQEAIRGGEAVAGFDIRKGVFDLIKSDHSNFSEKDFISLEQLNHYRRKYLTQLIVQERGELIKIDSDVMNAIQTNAILSENLQTEIDSKITFGQRIADKIAAFGGSWSFIIAFFLLFYCGWF